MIFGLAIIGLIILVVVLLVSLASSYDNYRRGGRRRGRRWGGRRGYYHGYPSPWAYYPPVDLALVRPYRRWRNDLLFEDSTSAISSGKCLTGFCPSDLTLDTPAELKAKLQVLEKMLESTRSRFKKGIDTKIESDNNVRNILESMKNVRIRMASA